MSSEDDGQRSVRAWLDEWQSLIRARDFDQSRELFDEDVFAFGTVADVMTGIDQLVERQWRATWSFIEGFTFNISEGRIEITDDRSLAWVATPWRSIGVRASGETFERGGRATIILKRSSQRSDWKAVHTHVSLNRGAENPRPQS